MSSQATLTTPVPGPTENNLRVESYSAARSSGGVWEVSVSVRDGGGVELRRTSYTGPDATHPGATALAFVTAQMTIRAGGETGNNARKMDYRLLGFLSDNGYLPAVTLVP